MEEGNIEEGIKEEGVKKAKRFSIIHIPLFSFFSRDLYSDVGLNWKGVNFGYLLLFLGICWIPTMIKMHVGFTNFVENEAPEFFAQVPDITITDGVLSISEEEPYYVRVPESNDVMVVIDTTGTINTLEDANALCLVTGSKITWRKSALETQTMDLSQIEEFSLTSKDIMGWLRTANKFLVVVTYPAALLGSYVFRIIQALIYALVGLLFASWCKVSLSYGSLVRVAVVAMTPAMLAKTVLGMTGSYLPHSTLIFVAITLGYLLFGVKVISEVKAMEGGSEEAEEVIA